MSNKKQVWTYEMRLILYKTLCYYFGDYQGYKSASNDKKEPILNSLKYVLNGLTPYDKKIKSIKAIENQIEWALTKQKEVDCRYIGTWHHNVSAALESGFYTSSYCEKYLLRDL